MFQDSTAFAGVGVGIASGTQPVDGAPLLKPGIHLRWANAPERGFPLFGHYLLRRLSSAGEVKPVSILSDSGDALVEATEWNFDGYRTSATTSGATHPSNWIEFTFTDQSYIARVDVLFTAGSTGEVSIKGKIDGQVVDEATVEAGTFGRQTVSVTGSYLTSLRIEGDVSLVMDVRLHSQEVALSNGWKFVPGVDQPLTLPLSHTDYPATSAPATPAAGRAMAEDRIVYGSADRFVATEAVTADNGTVEVTTDSVFVEGTGTSWDASLAGEAFTVDGDDDPYVVLSVTAPDRLVLDQPYAGPDATGQGYTIRPDTFASIHESLRTLVEGGPTRGGMAARAVPTPVEQTGTVTRQPGETTVNGQGTSWTSSLEGLGIQVAHETTGTVGLTNGDQSVEGIGTSWTDSLEGAVFVVDGQLTRYEVTRVVSETEFELDRPYLGPTISAASGGTGYELYERDVARIKRVASPSRLELDRPHAGVEHGSGRPYRILGSMGATSDSGSVRLPAQYPYELLAVGSVDPAMSQLLGTYWVDDTVETNRRYDYLIVADFTGVVDLLADIWDVPSADDDDFSEFVEDIILLAEYDYADAFLVPGLTKGDTDPPVPSQPTGVEVYELPESTTTGTDRDRYAAGVAWDRPSIDGNLPVDAPAAYFLWRDPLGESPGSTTPTVDGYDPIGSSDAGVQADFLERVDPILVAESDVDASIPGWPSEPIYAVDGRRPAGWYSYRVNGMDVFGRHTPLSDAAAWMDTESGQKATPPNHASAADYAIELRARLPPPPPTGVTATVLDPQDPSSADDAAAGWWAANGEQVALRIQWQWPEEFDAQAPDTSAFDCYVELGSLNSHSGHVTAVNQGPDTVRVTTSLSHTSDPTDDTTQSMPGGAFAGASLHVAGAQFTVVDSGGGSGLWVDVLPREGPNGALLPGVDVDCAITIPPVYSFGTATVVDGDNVVTGRDTEWNAAFEGQTIRLASTGVSYEVVAVDSATRLRLDRPYEAPSNRDDREAVAYAIDHPLSVDYSDHESWSVHVADVAIDDDVRTLRRGGDRFYETTVPAPGSDGGAFDPGVGPGEFPVVHANVGVGARIDANPEPMRGSVGGPAPVVRAHRIPPDPPDIPPLSSEIDWATRPDYEKQSYYTVRWVRPPEGVKTHVYRAMDRTLFRVDWKRRTGTDPAVLEATATDAFPPALRGSGAAETQRREEITTTLMEDLPAVVASASDQSPASFAEAEPIYESLAPDELQTLAGLSGNEAGFTQLTTDPLGRETPNLRGPDYESGDPGPSTQPGVDGVPDTMPPGDDLCAYVDAFDGRSRNRYLYRVATVDDAHNRSTSLGYPLPPTQARDGVPPETPVVAGIVAGHPDAAETGDRQLTLSWAVVQSPDLAEYRVYRTDDQAATRDTRLMDKVATLTVPIPAPEDGESMTTGTEDNSQITWTNDDCDAGVDWHYRVVAVDEAGNTSAASTPVAGRSFDTTPPIPPTITAVEWVRVGPDGTVTPYDDPVPADETWIPSIRVAWGDPRDLRVLVEFAVDDGTDEFVPVSSWLETSSVLIDSVRTSLAYRLRLKALDPRGRNTTSQPMTIGSLEGS